MTLRKVVRATLVLSVLLLVGLVVSERDVKADGGCNRRCIAAPTGHGLCAGGNKLRDCQNVSLPGVCLAKKCGTFDDEWEEVEADDDGGIEM